MDSQKYAPVRLQTLVKVKKVSCLSVYRICVQTHGFMSDSDILSLPKVTYIVLQIPHLNSQFGWKTNFQLLRQFSQKKLRFRLVFMGSWIIVIKLDVFQRVQTSSAVWLSFLGSWQFSQKACYYRIRQNFVFLRCRDTTIARSCFLLWHSAMSHAERLDSENFS